MQTLALISSASQWWEGLVLSQQVFFGIAIVASFVIAILALLAIFGIGDGDADAPDFDGGVDGGDLGLFSLKPIVGCLFVFGWVGGVCREAGHSVAVSSAIGLVSGAAALLLLAWLLRAAHGLRRDGTVRLGDAVGRVADVYLAIPPANTGSGQVTVPLGGRTVTVSAIQSGASVIPSFAKVKVLELVDHNTVRVEAIV